jgi:hypothetical protein
MAALVIHRRQKLVERELLRWSEKALPPLHQASVLGDSKNPRTDPLGFAEIFETLKHFEQCLLRYFLGVLAVAAHQPAIVEDLRAEVFHKAIEGLWFSSNQLPREFDFSVAFQGQFRFSL